MVLGTMAGMIRMQGKAFVGNSRLLGRGNGSRTQALFKKAAIGTKQLKKAAPVCPPHSIPLSTNQCVADNSGILKPNWHGPPAPSYSSFVGFGLVLLSFICIYFNALFHWRGRYAKAIYSQPPTWGFKVNANPICSAAERSRYSWTAS